MDNMSLKENLQLFNQFLTNYNSGTVTKEMMEAAKKINNMCSSNAELATFIKSLYDLENQDERSKLIEEYINKKNSNVQDTKKENLDEDLKDMLPLIEEKLQAYSEFYSLDEVSKVARNILTYYENPDLMLNLPDKDKKFYEELVDIFSKKREMNNNLRNQMIFTLENENSQGFLNIIFLSLIMIMLVMLIIYIIN